MAVFDDLTVLLKYQNDPRNAQAVGRGRKQLTGLKSSALATGLAVGGIALASTLAFRKIYQLGREAVKTFAEVETNLSTIEGLVGISAQQLAEWGPALQEIRRVSGRDLAELSRGLYDITSAGLRGDVALEALDVSARASASGLGETRVVADLLTSAINAWGPAALSATRAGDDLAKAVELGKLPADALAGAMGQLIPIASEMGLEFGEMSGLMAAMSRTGTGAETAAVQIGQALVLLLETRKPSDRNARRIRLHG